MAPALAGAVVLGSVTAVAAGLNLSDYITPSPGHPDYRFGVAQAYSDPAQASQLGVGWERITMFWSSLEPAPGVWNNFFTKDDSVLLNEAKAGRVPVGVLVSTPRWARVSPSSSVPRGLFAAWNSPKNTWGNFVYHLARHYAGLIDTWVIGNEISIARGHFNTWNGTIAQFAQLVKVAYLAAHAANPNAHILLPGTPYWYSHGKVTARLIADLAKLPGSATHHDFFDALDLNLYNTINYNPQIYARYRRILKAAGLAGTPIWLSETNVTPIVPGYKAPANDPGVPPTVQASFIVEEIADALAYSSRVDVYQLPEPSRLNKVNGPVGLLTKSGAPRPAFYAYETTIRYLQGARYLSRFIPPFNGVNPPSMDVINFGAPRRYISVIWDQGGKPILGRVKAYVKTALLVNDQGGARLIFAKHGTFNVHLPAATLTGQYNRGSHPIGGAPYFVIQRVRLGAHGTPRQADFGSRTGFAPPAPTPWTKPPIAALNAAAKALPEVTESVSGSLAAIAETPPGAKTPAAVVNTLGDQIWVKDGSAVWQFGKAGTAPGELNMPSAAAWSPQGTLYVADQGNARIEEFSAHGKFIRSFGHWGVTGSGMLAPSGIAVAPNGTVYVTDAGTQRVLHFSATGKLLGYWGGWGSADGRLNGPSGIAVSPNGTVFVADTLNNRVESFSPNGTYLQQGSVPAPAHLQLNANGTLTVTNYRMKTFVISDWPGFSGSLPAPKDPTALAFAPDGSYYVATKAGVVEHLSPRGTLLGEWIVPPIPGNHGKTPALNQLIVDGSNVLALDSLYNRILVLFPTATRTSPGVVGWIDPAGKGLLGPRAMAVQSNGTLWVADTDDHEVVHLAPDGQILGSFRDKDSPYGIALGPKSLWVAGYYGGVFTQYRFDGRPIIHFFTNGDGLGQLHRPTTVLADGANWLVWDRGNRRVLEVSPTGAVLSTVSDTSGNPVSIALAPNGDVAFLNSGGQVVLYHFGPTVTPTASDTVDPS